MPRIKVNNITMNYDQEGTGEPLILIPYLAADHACTLSRSQSTPSTLPASRSTSEGRVKQTNPRAPTPRSFSRTMWQLSCKPWDCRRRISPACPSVRP